jgi:hypothetical protein
MMFNIKLNVISSHDWSITSRYFFPTGMYILDVQSSRDLNSNLKHTVNALDARPKTSHIFGA